MRKFKWDQRVIHTYINQYDKSVVSIVVIVDVEPDSYVGSLPYKVKHEDGECEWCSESELSELPEETISAENFLSLQRYDITAEESYCECCGPKLDTTPCDQGDWVLWEDVEKLFKK